ncbi:MAG: sigma factor, partial [Planctomycetota bacterium]
MDEPSRDPEALLALMPWARQLAGRLVQSPELADDLAQDACVAALEGRGFPGLQRGSESKARAWLGAVTRHLAYRSHRSRASREARESAASRSEVDPAAN